MSDGTLPELAELAQWIRAAEDLEEALRTLAGALDGAGFAPIYCALAMIELDGTFRVAGMWSATPTRLAEGWIIDAAATEEMRRNADELLKGRAIRIVLADEGPGLFFDMAAQDGVRAFIVAPVGMPDRVVGVLAVASADPEAIARIDLDEFQDLARSVGRWIIMKA